MLAVEAPRRDIAGASDTQAIDLSAIDHAAIGRMAIAPAPTAAASRAHRDNCYPRVLAGERTRRDVMGASDTQAMDLSHFDDAAVERKTGAHMLAHSNRIPANCRRPKSAPRRLQHACARC